MKKKLYLFSSALIVFSLFASVTATAIVYEYDCTGNGSCALYVDVNHNGIENGEKATPFVSITDAINKIKSSSDYNTIYVAKGTYNESASMPWEIDGTNAATGFFLMGGYDSNFTAQNPETNPTTIQVGSTAMLSLYQTKGRVSGFTITGADGDINVIDINQISAGNTFEISKNKMRNNTHVKNVISVAGEGTLVVKDNQFYYNSRTGGNPGSILRLASTTATLENNLFYNNTIDRQVYCIAGTVRNNFIVDNVGQIAIYTAGDCSVYHNTIFNNELNYSNSTIIRMEDSMSEVLNNLIANNTSDIIFEHYEGDTSLFDFNAMSGNSADPGTPSDNNVLCAAQLTGDLTKTPELGAGSSCIDKGTNLASVTVDYKGITRPADGDGDSVAASDPGAYEAPAGNVSIPVISNVQITPNPFSPDNDGVEETTTVKFDIDVVAIVNISVYDAAGATEIVKLINAESRPAGTVSVVWDGSDGTTVLADGNYTIKYSAANTAGIVDGETTVMIESAEEEPEPEPGQEECAGYSDVPANHPSCDAIEYVQSIGAMTGNPNGTFAPDEALQRDQVAKISLETFGLFNSSTDYCNGASAFPDVPSSQWSYQYICQGVDIGMITGYESGADAGFYRPSRQVNRVEFLALILRNVSDIMPADSSVSYNDVESGQWFSGYAKYSMNNDLFTGNNLFPTQTTRRVEVADIIYKLHNLGKI